jgi:hypothetical protein
LCSQIYFPNFIIGVINPLVHEKKKLCGCSFFKLKQFGVDLMCDGIIFTYCGIKSLIVSESENVDGELVILIAKKEST